MATEREDERLSETLESRLARIEERVNAIKESVDALPVAISELDARTEQTYITRAQFLPVQAIAYGFIGIVCTGFITALGMLLYHVKP